MKILTKDIKHGIVKLELRNIDDLWVLYNVEGGSSSRKDHKRSEVN